ncbi:GFA family protein [Rhizobium sp. TRM96647]|uniref:GFA family protein n=1 Tax=unclassified Rhizobium TaxID=2613769 RepID=UPI0021E90410|nr:MULTISPECIES: GFA family protein [unclassified Rhizobium]MCV3739501.1 GFA family protein [Rhizobium sp. TRM96647]MCV3761174.1 GFA family protein [Rhizobium sp. TRM96650]
MRLEHGHCFCGAIEATFKGDPFWICFDHDDDCRRALGSPLTIWIGYKSSQVTFDQGQPATYSKTRGVLRSFCGKCGTSISYTDNGLSDDVYICVGFMDAPERFEPQAHGYWELRLPYIVMGDDLPREVRYTRDRDPSVGTPRERR